MNANFIKTLNMDTIKTKEDIILALTEAEVEFKRTMKKADLMEVLLNAIETVEAQDAHDRMNANNGTKPIEPEAHVVTLEEVESAIKGTMLSDAYNSHERAKLFYDIYTMKLYEELKGEDGEPCDSFKFYVEKFRGGSVYGVKYSMAMNYVNLCKFVYPMHEAFRWYGTHLLNYLIKPMRKEPNRGVIIEAVNDGRLNEHMTAEEFRDALKVVLGEADEIEGNASADEETEDNASTNKREISDEALDEALLILHEFIENNAHDQRVNDAYFTVMKALDR